MTSLNNTWEAFVAVRDHVERHPELVASVHTTYLFRISNPDGTWLLDLRNGKGAVLENGRGADCILDLDERDLLTLVGGSIDLATLAASGRLTITGETTKVEKLAFLGSLDRAQAAAAVARARAAGDGPGVAEEEVSGGVARAYRIFGLLHRRFLATPELANEVQAIVAVRLSDPESTWTIHARGPTPSIAKGASPDATATLYLRDIDFDALAAGTVSARDLLQDGRMRVEGDASVANRLGFLKHL